VFNIGGGEVLVILIVALIFLGPTKLPEIARALGKTTQVIRRVSESFRSELDAAVDDGIETQARQRGSVVQADNRTDTNEMQLNPEGQESDDGASERTPAKDDEAE